MRNMKIQQANGWASALRVNRPSTTNLKTRIPSCRIAVRADHEKCDQLTENCRRFCGFRTSVVDAESGVPMIRRDLVRLTALWRLKTDNSQRSCRLLFPYATGRRSTTGLLEQMP